MTQSLAYYFDKVEITEPIKEIDEFPEEILPVNTQTDQKELINAYTSGFFDGEGCIGAPEDKRRNPPTITLITQLGNTDLSILTKLKEQYGGEIYIQKKPKEKEHHKQSWNWDIKDRSTLKKFLTRIFPYSTVKKPQLELGLKFLELTTYTQGKSTSINEYNLRKKISDKLHELKQTELSECELNNFNTKIQEMNIDKNQPSLLDLLDSDKKDIEIIKVETQPEKIQPTYYSKEIINSYVAGFFDGEGCITTDEDKRNNPPTINLITILKNTDLPILTKLKQEYGGGISIQKKPKEKEHHKQSWHWIISDRTTLKKFLIRIFPYIQYKKPQIELGLTFIQLKELLNGKSPSQEQYNIMIKIRDKLHELKQTELSECELNNFNTQIQEMNIDKNQYTMMNY